MSSRPSKRPPQESGTSLATLILVDATPSPSPVPEDQRGTRARSKNKRPTVTIAEPPKPARRNKSKEGRQPKRAIDETLVGGIDFAPSKKARSRRSRLSEPGPSQSTLGNYVKRSSDVGPSNSTADKCRVRDDQPRRARPPTMASAPVKRTPSGGPNEPISIVSSDDERYVPRLKRSESRDRLSRKVDHSDSRSSSIVVLGSRGGSRGGTPAASGSTSARRNRRSSTPRQRARPKKEETDLPLPGSQGDWNTAHKAPRKKGPLSPLRARRSSIALSVASPRAGPLHRLVPDTVSQRQPPTGITKEQFSQQSNRVLVAETAVSMGLSSTSRVLVPETVVNRQSDDRGNPFYEPSTSNSRSPFKIVQQPPSPESAADNQTGVGASISEAFTFAPPRITAGPSTVGSRIVGPSAGRSPTPVNPSQSASTSNHRASTSKRPRAPASSATSGEQEPTPQKGNLLANLGRSPTKSPIKPPPQSPAQMEDSPPQMASVFMRQRAMFANDDDQSYRPAPRTKHAQELLKVKNLRPPPASRPQRVRSHPGKYKLPEVDTPIHEWPTTRGTTDAVPSRKKRKSDVLVETQAPLPNNPPATPLRGQRQTSSPLTPPPPTQAPLPMQSGSQCSVLGAASPSQWLEPLHSQGSQGLSNRRLSQVSQQRSPQASPSNNLSPRTPLRRGATPSETGSDFVGVTFNCQSLTPQWSKFAAFAGTPPPEDSQVPNTPSRRPLSPLAYRLPLSPRNSQSNVGGAPQRSSQMESTSQKPSSLRTLLGPHSSPQDLATRLLAQAEEDARRKREVQEQEERQREERNREMEELLEADEKEEEEVTAHLSLSARATASRSKSPSPPERRKSTRVVPPKAEPVPAQQRLPPRKKNREDIKNQKRFDVLMKMGQKSLAERAEWELAFANMAESREESAESELSGNALGLETAVGADQDLVARALEEEEIDRCDARARQLETMNVFWETEEEQREPKTEDELLKSLKEAGGLDEVWSLVSDSPSGTLLPLLSSGLVMSLNDESTPAVAMWLFRTALAAENDLALVASQQLLELVTGDKLEAHPFEDSIVAYHHLEAIMTSLGATGTYNDLPVVDVRVGREAGCTLVCELGSAMATAGWLLPLEAEKLLGRLLKLAIDPTTTPTLTSVVAAASNVLLTVSLQVSSFALLAMTLAGDLIPLSMYHKSVAVLALGQGSATMRTLGRLLATEVLLSNALEHHPNNATGPSEAVLNEILDHLMDTLMTQPADWVDVAAMVTLYAAAASNSSQFARPSRNKEMGRHCPFQPMLAQAQQRITKIEHHQPRAMIVKSRLAAIETSSRYAAQLAWKVKEQQRLGCNGLDVGHGGQARLSLGGAAR